MPRPLPPEQQEALEARGVVIPGPQHEALPAETVARVLGNVGLPHSDKVDRLDEENRGTTEYIGTPKLRDDYIQAYKATQRIMGLVDETLPGLFEDGEFADQLESLMPAFEVFEKHHLEPEIVLTPANRSVDFWVNLYDAVQDSPLNSNHAKVTGAKVLRNGLSISNEIKSNWTSLTDSESDHAWNLSVISALSEPMRKMITSYGYIDSTNQLPSNELNKILQSLGKMQQHDRTNSPGNLLQPDIHPSPDTYLMYQLARIIQNREPVDSFSYSWLNGKLDGSSVPAGTWNSSFGRVGMDYFLANNISATIGIRPSVRANHA